MLLDSWLDAATGAEGLLNARADGLALTEVAVARRSAGKRRNIVARVKRKRTVYTLVCELDSEDDWVYCRYLCC